MIIMISVLLVILSIQVAFRVWQAKTLAASTGMSFWKAFLVLTK